MKAICGILLGLFTLSNIFALFVGDDIDCDCIDELEDLDV